jgi:hypothetical protein
VRAAEYQAADENHFDHEKRTSGAKARVVLRGFDGTTEVVPFPKPAGAYLTSSLSERDNDIRNVAITLPAAYYRERVRRFSSSLAARLQQLRSIATVRDGITIS